MIELNQLQQLVCIADNGTISKAAEELHLSQPALSRSMKKLEEELNIELFLHCKNRVVLNDSGKLAVKHARKILRNINTMEEEVIKFDQSQKSITIATCTPSPLWTMEPLIQSIYPGIKIKSSVFNPEELLSKLHSSQFQMILAPFPVSSADTICLPYTHEDLMLSLPPNHPLSKKKVIHFSDLNGQTMLLYSNIGFWHDLHVKKTPHTRYLLQEERQTFNEIVKSSSLPSYTTNLAIQKEGSLTNRIIIPIDESEAHVTYYAVLLKKDQLRYKDLIASLTNP